MTVSDSSVCACKAAVLFFSRLLGSDLGQGALCDIPVYM